MKQDTMNFSPVILTVDVVLISLINNVLHVALLQREAEPFARQWALPGGYVHANEDIGTKAAAERVLQQKTGVVSPYLEEFGTFSGPARDPRGWSLSVVYYALIPPGLKSPAIQWFEAAKLPHLPFDHSSIVSAVMQRIRNKAGYSSLPVHLCAEPFTIPDLQAVYETILGEPLNKANFRRKLDDLQVLEAIPGATRLLGRSRPSQLYRIAKNYRDKLSIRERGL